MSKGRYELLSKHLSCMSEGILLAVVVGLGTGQLGLFFAFLAIFRGAPWFEEKKDGAH